MITSRRPAIFLVLLCLAGCGLPSKDSLHNNAATSALNDNNLKLAKATLANGDIAAARDLYAQAREIANHFADRGVLAADEFDVSHAQTFNGDDIGFHSIS